MVYSDFMEGQQDLKRQLEIARFERAMEMIADMADRRVLLTTAELGRFNTILTGSKSDSNPWRVGPVTLSLPSGRKETFSLIADPKINVRQKLHHATELAEGGAIIDAAVEVYTGLVLVHAFSDANRRTAVLAAHYFLQRYGIPLSGMAVHEMGLGDLREPGQIGALRDTLAQMARFAASAKRTT